MQKNIKTIDFFCGMEMYQCSTIIHEIEITLIEEETSKTTPKYTMYILLYVLYNVNGDLYIYVFKSK